MGEIAEMMLDGTLCEGCGEYMGDGTGYPRYCRSCAPKGNAKSPKKKSVPGPIEILQSRIAQQRAEITRLLLQIEVLETTIDILKTDRDKLSHNVGVA